MSIPKRDRSGDGEGSDRESKREKRRRQRVAARRQKELAASERRRRDEAKKAKLAKADEKPAKAEVKPAKPATPAAKSKSQPRGKMAKPAAAKRFRGSASKVGGSARKVGTSASKVGGGAVSVAVEVLKLGREMLVIPLQVWLGIAEVVGGIVLAAWLRVVLPALRLTWRALGAVVHFGERHVTPARALTVVAAVAIGVLVAAQWRDYSAVSVGVDAYSGDVGAVAPPPEVSSTEAHDAHGWVMLVFAALGALALLGAISKRRRLGIWLVAIGVAVLVVSLAIDAPKGLDEGDAAISYTSASASLLSGFWLQVAAGAVLVACGLMLPRALRPARAPATELGPSLLDQLAARVRATRERRRARPKRERRLPNRLRRRPAGKGKVQGAGT